MEILINAVEDIIIYVLTAISQFDLRAVNVAQIEQAAQIVPDIYYFFEKIINLFM